MGETCSTEGCEGTLRYATPPMCHRCYERQRARAQKLAPGRCLVPTCNRWQVEQGMGLCPVHYARAEATGDLDLLPSVIATLVKQS